MNRQKASRTLYQASRITFSLSALLAMLTPSWKHGIFTFWPLVHVRSSGQHFQVGILALLPLLSGITWVIARLLERPGRALYLGPVHMALPVLGFAAWVLIRIWPIHVPHIAVLSCVAACILIGAYLYVIQDYTRSWCLGLIALFLFVQGTVAVAQFLKQGSVGLAWIGEGWLDPESQGISVIEAGGRRWLRAYGLTPHPNVLGGYLSMGALIVLGALRTSPPRIRRWLWVALAAGVMGLFGTFSRSAWLGTAAGTAYLAYVLRSRLHPQWIRQHKRQILVALSLALVGVIAVGILYKDLLVTRFFRLGNPLEATSIQERLVDYRQAWGLIRAVPIKGTGSGYYIAALWAGVGDDRPPGFRRVHNTYLLAAAELGIGGAVLWLWMLFAPPIALALRGRQIDDLASQVGWAAAFVSAAVLCLFDSYLYAASTWWPALFLGLLAGAWARNPVVGRPVERAR